MPRVFNRRRERAPVSAVYVGRPTVYGNPFTVEQYGSQSEAVRMYKKWIYDPEQEWLRELISRELRGCDLICWCKPWPCHADVILKIANRE